MANVGAPCLDEDTVIALAQGSLSAHALNHAEAHLAECDACRALLAQAVTDADRALRDDATHTLPPVPSQPPFDSEQEIPQAGTVLADKYVVDKVLGQGGMGVVLAATHRVLRNRVAIKVLRRIGPNEVTRFLREARICAQIRNPHITSVFDFGQLPNGAPFLVMEYLEGRDLAHCLEDGPLAVEVALDYVLQACDAIRQVHALGIVHRDLKPANLFLTEDHGRPLIKVLDFGIYKSTGTALPEESARLTGAHALIGSPVYMSPEQMQGGEIDARSDVWSLGVILYELCTGVLPFGERTLSALAVAVATEEPRRPSQLVPTMPRALDGVIMRCLSKRPADRYGNAGELAAALASLRAGEPAARPRRGLLVLAAALAIAAAAWWLERARPSEPVRTHPLAAHSDPIVPAPPPPEPEATPVEPQPAWDAGSIPAASTRRSARRHGAKPAPTRQKSIGPTDTPD